MQDELRKLMIRFGKVGYKTVNWDILNNSDALSELDLVLTLAKAEIFDLEKEWTSLKKVASSLGYYIIPSNELSYKGKLSVAVVTLVKKELIYKMQDVYFEMYQEIDSSYWALQADKVVLEIKSRLMGLQGIVESLQIDLKLMNTGTKHVELFTDWSTYHSWKTYCLAFEQLHLIIDLEAKDKVPTDFVQRIAEIGDLFHQ